MNFIKTPYLQLPETDGITVMWETDTECTSRLLVWEAFCPDCGDIQYIVNYMPQGEPRVFAGEAGYTHSVTATGLESGKDYCYQAISSASDKEITSECQVFRTRGSYDDAFSLAVTSEFGGATFGGWYPLEHSASLIGAMSAERPDFLLFVGDMVWDGKIKYEWDTFMFKPFRKIFSNTPFYHCAGNHENHSEYMKDFLATSEKGFYDFTYGNAHFVALDSSQFVDYVYDEEGNIVTIGLLQDLTDENPQMRFLTDSLKNSYAKWKFVFFHHPPYFAGNFETAVLRPLGKVFEEYDVDIVFNSHAVVYERSHPIRNDVIDYSKGVRYIVVGGAGDRPEWFHHKKAWHTAKSRAVPHFVHLVIAGGHLELQAIDYEGRLFDTMVIEK